jgi:hypothetical protein
MPPDFDHWLDSFRIDAALRPHVAAVFAKMPGSIRDDLMADPHFHLYDYEPGAAAVMHVPVGLPTRGRPARSVVLKRSLRRASVPFVRWIIAHEIAHAHLRNAGRWHGEDPEQAANALAEQWGFPKPPAW